MACLQRGLTPKDLIERGHFLSRKEDSEKEKKLILTLLDEHSISIVSIVSIVSIIIITIMNSKIS